MTDPYVCYIWFAIHHQYTPVLLAKAYMDPMGMGLPPNHPFFHGMFHYKPSILGDLHLWNPPRILWIRHGLYPLTTTRVLRILRSQRQRHLFPRWTSTARNRGTTEVAQWKRDVLSFPVDFVRSKKQLQNIL